MKIIIVFVYINWNTEEKYGKQSHDKHIYYVNGIEKEREKGNCVNGKLPPCAAIETCTIWKEEQKSNDICYEK